MIFIIINLIFRISEEVHSWLCLWEYFLKGLMEGARPTFNVDGQEWMKTRKQGELPHPSPFPLVDAVWIHLLLPIPATMPSLPCWTVTLLQCEPKIPASCQIFGHSQQEKQIMHLYPLQKQKESLHISMCLANRSPDPCALVQLYPRRRALRNSGSFYWRLVFLWRKKILFKEISIAFNMPKQLWLLFLVYKRIIC